MQRRDEQPGSGWDTGAVWVDPRQGCRHAGAAHRHTDSCHSASGVAARLPSQPRSAPPFTPVCCEQVIGVAAAGSLAASLIIGFLASEPDSAPPPSAAAAASSADGVGKAREGKAAPADGIVACPLGTRLVAAVATVCAVSALYNCGSATYAAFFGPLAQDLLGLGIGGIGRAYTALACLSFAVSAGGSARVQGTIGTVATCALGLAAVGASLLLMGAATLAAAPRPSLVFWAGAALYQLGTPLYAPTVPTMLLQCVPRHRRGAVMGLDEAINTVARVGAPLLFGQLYHTLGAAAAFGAAGSAVLFAAVIAVLRRMVVLRSSYA